MESLEIGRVTARSGPSSGGCASLLWRLAHPAELGVPDYTFQVSESFPPRNAEV